LVSFLPYKLRDRPAAFASPGTAPALRFAGAAIEDGKDTMRMFDRNWRLKASLALALGCGALAAGTGPSRAEDPSGTWLVADRSAQMKVELCRDGYYASIAWEKQPGVDSQNPDPAKRGRPLNGVSILMGMKESGTNEWDGQVYNPKDGRVYHARMILPRHDALRIEGCVLGGLICDGETWLRTEQGTTGANQGRPRSYCPQQ
jgi:uncharacterized protein (DUF2147 family)